jgi:hypothetical protein
MASLIHEIENNESLLLMYSSGELSADDRLEVEQMLAGDAVLRQELADIESAYQFAIGSLAELDADRAAIAGENHAIRQAKRAMKQWQIDRLNRQPVREPAPARRVPSWAYPSAVAAMLLIGMLTYWGVAGDSAGTGTGGGSGTVATNTNPDTDHPLPNRSSNSGDDELAGISDAESKAQSLVARSDDSEVDSSVFWK